MTETASARDLRARMQRIATKPRTQPDAAPAKRGARTVHQHRSRVASRPRAGVPSAARRSRLETLLAWGKWELTAVPVDRAQWLIAVVRGKSPAQATRRGQR